jgi:hypothetical protein
MLNPAAFVWVSLLCFAIWGFYTWRLNALGLKRDADSAANTPFWIKKLENISGPGIVVYALTMTAAVIYWVMSLDPTWYSSVYGLLFLVGQGYQVLALRSSWPFRSRRPSPSRPFCARPSSTTWASSPSPS